MSLSLKTIIHLVKPFACTARFSARYPIHVIVIAVLLSAAAYLSVTQSYLNEWKLDSNQYSTYLTIKPDELFERCTHYYRSPVSDTWKLLSSKEAADIYTPFHYYLSTINFQSKANSTTLPSLEDVIYSIDHTRYVLSEEPKIPTELTSEGGTKWRLRSNSNLILDLHNTYRNLVKQFSNKTSEFDQFDLLIILAAYLTLFYTLCCLFNDMRKIGSKFWLSFSALSNSACALYLSLYTTHTLLKKPASLLSLIVGLPFIVVIIGFKHKVRLATLSLQKFHRISIDKKVTVSNIIYEAIFQEGTFLIRDYLFYISSFVGCAIYARHLTGLVNFCILATFMLIFDLILSATFYSAILSMKLEINIIHRSTLIRQTLEEDGVFPTTADIIYKDETAAEPNFLRSNVAILIGKASVIGLLLLINLYVFTDKLNDTILNSVYFDSTIYSLPNFINYKDIGNLSNQVIISVLPKQHYTPLKKYHQIEDSVLLVIDSVSSAIRDQFISKLLFFAFAVSISINIYLLNAAKIHTGYMNFEPQSKVEDDSLKQKSTTMEFSDTLSTPVSSGLETPITTKNIAITQEIQSNECIYALSSQDEPIRPLSNLVELMEDEQLKTLNNTELSDLVVNGRLPLYALEKKLDDTTRAVLVRRKALSVLAESPVLVSEKLPFRNFDYDRVFGACCENVIGYMPLPVGVIGPLIIDGASYHIPMATTEGCLVASAMRGCKAINAGGGATTVLTKDGMTRGPVVRFPTLIRSGACKIWLDSEEGQNIIKKAFNSTSRFARLQHIQTCLAGDLLFMRFRTTTGDAMGMNMISKGVEHSLKQMVEEYGWNDMEVVSVSGNYCTDKKPAAINWIEGRGKSVVAEATIPGDVVRSVLKSDVAALVELNIAKNLVGSAMAGSVGGFNAHAANLVTALFLALGQDPAQNVESSNCITLMKEVDGNLRISVSMPSIEVGTIGGGTVLEPQGAMLDLLGVRGPHPTEPGANARQLARIIACAVLAGELSLCSALAAGHLVQSHMTHNRKTNKTNEQQQSSTKTPPL
ncbi:hypothetical protein SUVZ_12G4720 [Saccharomyces uvarum]|uniref:3-hydroxy-3-methylglutaryl coenzyme A reductase n=1 Tax=Saccharomyces uvarum TaxID=230603 RepID=A0ABN8WHN7_SACUV|nr:hypothetical protein SUVZ_12G4720 [Saccharomyces uvarum]